MKKILKLLMVSFLFCACSSQVKTINMHTSLSNKNLKKNFYLKDENRSFERLKGTWVWTSKKDSLIIESIPIYKKPYDKTLNTYENAYYDSGVLNVRYVKDGEVILDRIGKKTTKNCLIISPFKVQTNVFYLNNFCKKDNGSYLILRGDNEQLFLVSPYTEKEKVLLSKDGEYEIVIPHSIVLDRISY